MLLRRAQVAECWKAEGVSLHEMSARQTVELPISCTRRSCLFAIEGYLFMTRLYSSLFSTASSVGCCAMMLAVRTCRLPITLASPNQAPLRKILWPPMPCVRSTLVRRSLEGRRGTGSSDPAWTKSSVGTSNVSGQSALKRATSSPLTIKTRSSTSCPASPTRSPAEQCTSMCAWASSATKECIAPLNSGKRPIVPLKIAKENVRWSAGERRAKSSGSSGATLTSLLSAWRKLRSTLRCRPGETLWRRMNWDMVATQVSTLSSKTRSITLESAATTLPKKIGERNITRMANTLAMVLYGWMSP
mmetsp:Transcript_123220/g.334649  ORF Transcript_123220/g.334649 Transcript_123220/m.334649 type:complete len:303 (+) Transcript_123220:177-1085(+)